MRDKKTDEDFVTYMRNEYKRINEGFDEILSQLHKMQPSIELENKEEKRRHKDEIERRRRG